MTQTVIGIFDTPDAAHAAEEALLDQGIEQSCLHLASQENAGSGIRSFLSDLFGPDNPEEADSYAEAIEHGGALLSVDLPDDAEIQPVQETLVDAGAMDLEDLMEQWRREESAEYEQQEETQAEGGTIPVVEEEMEIGKQQIGKGKVRVVSRMVETPVEEDVNLREERATIKRRPVDRPAGPEDLEDHGEQSFEVEETAEKPVVSKSARVVEEIEVGKESSETTQTVGDTVRRTEVDVERQPTGGKRKAGKKK